MLTTTFELLHKHGACTHRYKHLAKALCGIAKYGHTTPIPLAKLLDTNGIEDCLWALRATDPTQDAERDILARKFACRCVRETPLGDGRTVWDLLTDERSRNAVVVAEAFLLGKATNEELAAAWSAAWDAAWEYQAKILKELLEGQQ